MRGKVITDEKCNGAGCCHKLRCKETLPIRKKVKRFQPHVKTGEKKVCQSYRTQEW